MKEKKPKKCQLKIRQCSFPRPLIQESNSPPLPSKLKKEFVRELLLLKVTITHLHFFEPRILLSEIIPLLLTVSM